MQSCLVAILVSQSPFSLDGTKPKDRDANLKLQKIGVKVLKRLPYLAKRGVYSAGGLGAAQGPQEALGKMV